MKKVLLCVVFISGLASYAAAQDVITKRDGTDIKAKTIEVSSNEVKYKLWDNQNGPVFILSASEVVMIRFEDGSNYVMDPIRVSTPDKTDHAIFTNDKSLFDTGNLKYYQLKNYYDKANYDLLQDPKYGRGYPWLNLILPGLSQYCMGENGLGTRFLLMHAGSSLIYVSGLCWLRTNYTMGSMLMVIGIPDELATTVWSIVNAYNVAKVKSLYISDLKHRNQGYSFSLSPTVLYASTPAGFQPAPGLGLRVTF